MNPQVPAKRLAASSTVVIALVAAALAVVLIADRPAAAATRHHTTRHHTATTKHATTTTTKHATTQNVTSSLAHVAKPRAHDPAASRLARLTVTQRARRGRINGSPVGGNETTTPTAPTTGSEDTVDPTVAGLQLTMHDEFDGSSGAAADAATWNYNTGGAWGSHELQCYTDGAHNASTDGDGHLVLTARYEPGYRCPGNTTNDYTSARVTTEGLAGTEYGKIRIRAKVPAASGVWPAMWLMGDNIGQVGWPACGEIDMMEAIGQDAHTIYGTVHGPKANGGAWQTEQPAYHLDSPMNTGFHVYGVDWSPTELVMTVDGHPYTTLTKDQVLAAGNQWVFNRKFFLLLNVAVGGDWPGKPKDNSDFPQSMTVDYVRVYS